MTFKLFIGSTNKGKIADYKNYFQNLILVSPYDLNLKLKVPENNISLVENSKNKAISWSKISNLVTIADDTGFFIPALNGEPGVSVKTWGSQFSQELNNQEFIEVLKTKLENINDTSGYFETCYTLASPDEKISSFSIKNYGFIDKKLFDKAYINGYPLSAVFIANGRTKTWSDMNNTEKVEFDKTMIKEINKRLILFY